MPWARASPFSIFISFAPLLRPSSPVCESCGTFFTQATVAAMTRPTQMTFDMA